jgi:cytoskeletal protein CcmA (bactofilin family)
MECLSELTYANFVDGELPTEESERIRTHLLACAPCREIVAALTAENRMLMTTLAEAGDDELATATHRRPAWVELAVLAAVLAAIGATLHWINGQSSGSTLNWLNPFTSEGQNNLAFNLMFYLSHGGGTMLEHLASTIGRLALVLVAVAGFFLLARHRRFRSGISLVALAITLSLPGLAIETRSSTGILTIPQNETVNGTLIASAEQVEIEGVVKGDLFTAARSIVVRGTVTGNIFCWSQTVEVDGHVDGSIFSFAQNATVHGQVGHSVYSWVEFLRLEPGSQVASDVIVGSEEANLLGKVDGGVLAFAGRVNVQGDIGGNILAYVGEINLNTPAHVSGGLTATVEDLKNARIGNGVTIAGPTEIKVKSRVGRYLRPGFYIWRAIALVGAFLVGWVWMYLFPGFFATTAHAVGSGWRSFLLGFAFLVGTPVAIALVAITLIGLPLAFITFGLYLIGLYLAIVLVAAFLGFVLFKSAQPRSGQALLAYFVGLLILTVLFHLPFGIGIIFEFLAFCLGLGALMWHLYRTWRPAPV